MKNKSKRKKKENTNKKKLPNIQKTTSIKSNQQNIFFNICFAKIPNSNSITNLVKHKKFVSSKSLTKNQFGTEKFIQSKSIIQSPIKEENNKNFEFFFINEQESIKYVGEYLEDIYQNLLIEEQEDSSGKYGYMEKQPDINDQMRAILIDWLIEVHLRFLLRPETLFQTIYIIDAYLTSKKIMRSKLQLLGIASLLISCKSHEIYYPQLSKFIEITDYAYNKNELIFMEDDVLKILNFNLVYPTANDFFNILSKFFGFSEKEFFLGKYFVDSVLIDYEMIKYKASVIAASSAYLVMKIFGNRNYKTLYSNFIIKEDYPEKIIKEVAKEICLLVKNLSQSKLKAIKNKYSMPIFYNVAEYFELFLRK